jgi:hypothetical protein
MADIRTLEGISEARNDLYNKLESASIDERRALQMERVLRGQESLKAHVPIRLLGVVLRAKGAQAEAYAKPLMQALHKFTTGRDMPAIEERTGA